MVSVALKPRLSEKAYALSQLNATYVFDIPANANKNSVLEAVQKQYEVSVVSVRLASLPGKRQRSVKKGRRGAHFGQRANIRKAYVTLKKGDKLPVFEAIEEAAKESKK